MSAIVSTDADMGVPAAVVRDGRVYETLEIGRDGLVHLEVDRAGASLCGILLFPTDVRKHPGFSRGGGLGTIVEPCKGCVDAAVAAGVEHVEGMAAKVGPMTEAIEAAALAVALDEDLGFLAEAGLIQAAGFRDNDIAYAPVVDVDELPEATGLAVTLDGEALIVAAAIVAADAANRDGPPRYESATAEVEHVSQIALRIGLDQMATRRGLGWPAAGERGS